MGGGSTSSSSVLPTSRHGSPRRDRKDICRIAPARPKHLRSAKGSPAMFHRKIIITMLATVVFALGVWAQNAPTTPPGSIKVEPDLTPTDHEQIIAYWTSETGWKSELQLRNNLVAQDLTVTPALRLADGAETNLAAVTIKPQEVKS